MLPWCIDCPYFSSVGTTSGGMEKVPFLPLEGDEVLIAILTKTK